MIFRKVSGKVFTHFDDDLGRFSNPNKLGFCLVHGRRALKGLESPLPDLGTKDMPGFESGRGILGVEMGAVMDGRRDE